MAASVEDDEDCEVIFENSPLYWSMVDAGLEDIGQQDVHKVKQNSSSDCMLNTGGSGKYSWFRPCKLYVEELVSLLLRRQDNTAQVKESHRQVFATLAQSSLLTEEDHLFLQDLRAEGQQNEAHTSATSSSRSRLTVLFTAVTGLVLWAVCPWQVPLLHPWISIVTSTFFALLLPLLLAQVVKDWHLRRLRRRGGILLESVGRVLQVATKWTNVSAKCVRFIQESELVARGFTFVGRPGSSRVVRELQTASTRRRQCPLLRRMVFLAARSAFFCWRRTFAHLVHLCPVKVEVSGVMHYCSEIPLSQYPTMLQQDCSGEPDEATVTSLQDMTDGFSVDVLKSLQELNRIHMSEFLRRLAVCFAGTSEDMDLSTTLPSLLDSVSHDMESLAANLQSSLTAHRHGSVNAALKSPKSVAWQSASSPSQLRSTFTAVHSVELHLLAALKKIQDLSEAMESKLEEERSPDTTGDERPAPDSLEDPVRESWSLTLATIKSDLGACSGCLEEGVKQLERTDRPEASAAAIETKPATLAVSSSVNVVRVSAQDNPLILDEVFEAYSEPQDYDGRHSHCELTASEEEVWQKKQKSNLKQCLKELQSIIDVRAANWQERERIAMDRMKHAAGTAHSLEMSVRDCEDDNVDHHDLKERTLVRHSAPEEGLDTRGGALQRETVDDLADDVAQRVEFWKQFDQEVHMKQMNPDAGEQVQVIKKYDKQDSSVVGNENTASKDRTVVGNETTASKDNHTKGEDQGQSSDQFQDGQHCQFDEVVSASLSQDSGFVLVSHQVVHSDSSTLHPNSPDSDGTVKACWRLASVQTDRQTAQDSLDHLSCPLPSEGGPEEQTVNGVCGDRSEGGEGMSCNTESKARGGDDLLGEGQKPVSAFHRLQTTPAVGWSPPDSTGHGEADDSDDKVRSSPEGILEHLSLPAAPSPFAFSIASMVASRARKLTCVEDTFGDSSSEEGEEEDEGMGETQNS